MPVTQRLEQKDRTVIVPMERAARFLSHHERLGRERRRRARVPMTGDRRKGPTMPGVRGTLSVCRWIPFGGSATYIAGIYKALQIVYSDAHLADSWVKRPNRAFGGQQPLDRMRGGDVVDLAAVRTYVDAAQAPWS